MSDNRGVVLLSGVVLLLLLPRLFKIYKFCKLSNICSRYVDFELVKHYNEIMISFVYLGILITLMDGKLHTARDLADAHEVSTKTVRRAITALESAGVFVTSKQGKTGGYQIEKSNIPQLSSLSPLELGELMSIMRFKQSLLPSSEIFASLQDSIINSTPQKNLGEILSQSSKIIFDTLPWNRREISTQKFDKVYSACSACLTVDVDYVTYSGKTSKRKINPYCLTLKDGSWYAYGEDLEDQKMKLFKLSRMTKIALTDQKFQVSPNIDISSKPWNNSEIFSPRKIKIKIQNSKLVETREWLSFNVLETHETHTIAEAETADNLGFYLKLAMECKWVTLLSPRDMIENLLALCKHVENIYSFA